MSSPAPAGPNARSSLRVAITGASGFLGSALAAQLTRHGALVRRVRRATAAAKPDIAWLPDSGVVDKNGFEGLDAIVNLSGARIDRRWTASHKRAIRKSRTGPTSLLARTIAELRQPPRVFLSGSAIGIYGDRGEEELDERSTPGSGFLAETAMEWERATDSARQAGVRTVLLRTGIVLSPAGGALARMLLPFNLGIGGRIGSGRQWMSWISLSDWVSALEFLLTSSDLEGPVNLVASNPVPNVAFVRTLARVLGRPAFVPLSATLVGILFGEMGRTTLLGSQRVHPMRLTGAGFEFATPTLEQALRAELAGNGGP